MLLPLRLSVSRWAGSVSPVGWFHDLDQSVVGQASSSTPTRPARGRQCRDHWMGSRLRGQYAPRLSLDLPNSPCPTPRTQLPLSSWSDDSSETLARFVGKGAGTPGSLEWGRSNRLAAIQNNGRASRG